MNDSLGGVERASPPHLSYFCFVRALPGDAGCNPNDTSGLRSEGLATLGNVSGHELSETLTDPNGNAWYYSSGAENADKCVWTFSGKLATFANAAYTARTGYLAGTGCIDGS